MSPRPGPRRVVAWGALAAAFLVAQQVAAKTTRDALFLLHYPAAALPAVMMVSSLVSVACAMGVARLLVARAPAQAVPALIALNAVLLLGQYLLAATAPALGAALLYVQVAATGTTLISGYWSVVNERFDPWTAKRVVGRLGLGAALGGVVGGPLVWVAAKSLPLPTMLVLIAAVNVFALVAVVLFADDRNAAPLPAPANAAGWLATPYLRHLAAVVALGATTEALLEFALKARAAATFPDSAALVGFFAAFHTGLGVITLLLHTLLTRPTLEALGLAGSVSLRPIAVAVAALASLFDPRLWSAVLARGCHDVLTNSLFRAGYELLYTPLPEADKRAAKQMVDVGFDKLGALAGGAATFAAVRFLDAPDRAVLPLAAVLSVVALGLTRRLHRGYVSTLEESLRAGKVRLDPEEVTDSTTRLTLAGTDLALLRGTLRDAARGGGTWAGGETGTRTGAGPDPAPAHAGDPLLTQIAELRSGDAVRIRHMLRERERNEEAVAPELVAHLVPLLARDDVYLEVLRALRRLAPRVTGQLLDVLLDRDADTRIRTRLPRVLKACTTQRAVDGLMATLEDPLVELRTRCARALVASTRVSGMRVASERVFAAVRRELEATAEPDLEHVFTLLSLVLEREPAEIVVRAVRSEDVKLRGTALEYLDNVLPAEIRTALRPHVAPSVAPGPARARSREEVLGELRRSSEATGLASGSLRRRGLRPRD